MQISIKVLQLTFIFLVLIGLSYGSAYYLIHQSLKPSIVLIGLSLPILLAVHRKIMIDSASVLVLIFILIAAIYTLAYPKLESTKDFIYLAYIYIVLLSAKFSAILFKQGSKKPLNILILIIFCLIILYFYEIYSESMFVEKLNFSDGLYSSLFNNPNDFSSYLVVFSPLMLYYLGKGNNNTITYTVTYVFLLVTAFLLGSRAGALAMLLIPIAYLLFFLKFHQTLFPIILLIILYQLNWETILYSLQGFENQSISRSASKISLALYNFESDNSSNYRLDSYIHFIENITSSFFGTGTKNYSVFYGQEFSNTVVTTNPHSFFIEITLAFGWIGTFVMFLLFAKIGLGILSIRKKYKLEYFYGLTTIIMFIIASFIPSSILRLPILFFPLFFFYYSSLLCKKS